MSNLYEATKLAAKISKKANDSLSSLEHEMRIMGWKSEYCVVMWEIVARAALRKAAEAAALSAPAETAEDGRRFWSHVKTDGVYEEIARGLIEATLVKCVIYRGHDGVFWVRPSDEFDDGRFVRCEMPALWGFGFPPDASELAAALTANAKLAGEVKEAWAQIEAMTHDHATDVEAAGEEITNLRAQIAALEASAAEMQAAMRNIMPYLVWTIGPESPWHHPTLPSAVEAFRSAYSAALASSGGEKA